MEERVVDSQSAYPSTTSNLSNRVEMEMSDSSWMAREQLMKPVLLSQEIWSTTQAIDTVLYRVRFPKVLETIDSLVLRTLRMYAFYKLSPCFRIQINATQFHQGQLICSFDPFSMLSSYTSDDPNNPLLMSRFTATGLPSVKIMASESDAVELCIPFIHLRSFLTTNNSSLFNNMGTFDIRVLNPLLAADGASPNLSVSIWVYAKDAQVHVPIYDHEPILEPTSKNIQSKQLVKLSNNNSLFRNIKQGISQTTDIIGNVLTGNFGQALRKGQGLIDTVGSLFGFDYPSNTISPDKTIGPYENLAVAIGKSRSQRMAIDPFSMHILEDDIASESMTAMDLITIARTPMLLRQFTVSDSDKQGTSYVEMAIHPAFQETDIIGDNTYQPTYLSHVSSAFTYWSGGIVYDFEVVATRFHSAKLLIAYVPNVSTLETVTFEQALSSCPNAILDIQQTSKLSIIIPFTSTTPVKSVPFVLNQNSEIVQSSFAEACNGRLMVYLLNTLAHASNTASTIDINIYVSAADDYKLYVPRHPQFGFPGAPPPVLEATSGIGIVHEKNDIDAPTVAVLSKGQQRAVISSRYGENYTLRDIIKRFTPSSTLTNPEIPVPIFPVSPSALTDPTSKSMYDNFLSYWSGIYSAWTGSLRYKLYIPSNRTTTGNIEVYHIQDKASIDTGPPFHGYAMVATTAPQDNVLEFEAPYYSKYNMLLTRTRLSVDALNYMNGVLFVNEDTNPKLEVSDHRLYIAAGDDFRFIYLRPPLSTNTPFQSYLRVE